MQFLSLLFLLNLFDTIVCRFIFCESFFKVFLICTNLLKKSLIIVILSDSKSIDIFSEESDKYAYT